MREKPIPAPNLHEVALFYMQVERQGECWIWTGPTDEDGYGIFTMRDENYRAHRVSFSWLGGMIPAGLDLDHLCRRRPCVNPKCLEPVTNLENVRRGTHANRAKQACKRGHLLAGENLRTFTPKGSTVEVRRCRACERLRSRGYRKAGID